MFRSLGVSALLFLCAVISVHAQDLVDAPSVPVRKSSSYFALQANQLFRQLFNLGNASGPVNNPYLVTYSVNSVRTGWGFAAGMGYTYTQNENNDEFVKRNTTVNDLSLRLGVDKKSNIGKRWLINFGFDVVIDNNKNETSNATENEFQRSKVTTTTKSSGVGGGPRFGLIFQVSEKILIGTEANYYYKPLSNKVTMQTVNSIRQNGSGSVWQTTTEEKKTDSDTKQFQLNVPAVLFLIVKF